MSKISCDTCMDLMPLVTDCIASEDSRLLVEEHIKTCESCKNVFMSADPSKVQMNDKIIVGKIKKQLSYFILVVILIGAVSGMMLTNSMNMFYNALIMPLIGGLGFLVLRKKTVWLTVGLFAFTSIWQFIQFYITEGVSQGSSIFDLAIGSLFYSGIYTFFIIIGIVIAMLLEYAFRRDSK